jgi:uncharacterized protein
MSVYLDASVLVSLFLEDAHTRRAETFLGECQQVLVVSDFAAAEFASAIARRVRAREIEVARAKNVFAIFDGWTTRESQRVGTFTSDITRAEAALRQLDQPLRTPDALNIAICQRLGAALATFDAKMVRCARQQGIEVAKC